MNLQHWIIIAQQPQFEPAFPDGDVGAAGGAVAMICNCVIIIIFGIVPLVGMWKVFEKAGKPGWAAIIPIYNMVVLCEIVGRPVWWVLLLLIPCVNIVIAILLYIDLAKSYGQNPGFAIGLLLLPFIFFPILGFGGARYLGPAATPM